MSHKLDADAAMIGTQKDGWFAVYSCLGDGPKALASTYFLSGGSNKAYDPKDLLEYLANRYTDRNNQKTATLKLRELKQARGQTFDAFYVDFEKTLAEAGGMDWADQAKLAFLEGALNDQLTRSLVAVTISTDYAQAVDQIMLTASKLESLTPWLYPSPTKPPTELSSPSRKAWKQDEGEDTVITRMNPLDKKKPKG